MSSDKLVFDLSQEIEGSPNVFIKKDWLNILDNQSQNYNSNQSIVDTSQLSNSNKYMSYREGYFLIPMLLTLSTVNGNFQPATAATSGDYAIGLKNWFGTIIHSFTVDYNGVTIIQQTPYINMWNSFKLITSLSYNDIAISGSTIGFYPDDYLTFEFAPLTGTTSGSGVCNNTNTQNINLPSFGNFNDYASGSGNIGFYKRQQMINFDPNGIPSASGGTTQYTSLIPTANINLLWKSYVFNKVNQDSTLGTPGLLEIAITATVYLKHIHSFFSMIPLLKGVFLKMTMNLNNAQSTINITGTSTSVSTSTNMALNTSSVAVGGVNPIMIASTLAGQGGANLGGQLGVTGNFVATYTATLSVGGRCLFSSVASLTPSYQNSPLSQSVYLYLPAYSFNPVFEQAYLSSPIKNICYTDVYQYQVLNVAANANFNNLLTNGIANIKSILILPFYSSAAGSANTGISQGIPVFQSPFDPAGTGPTSPLCLFSNFNVVVSGQNAIYNTERYSFEQYNNQLYGQNSVNGGQTDGLCSGLINSLAFEMNYCYYYVNISRMLPIEEKVPKSVQIVGQNMSGKAVDLYCFIEYGVDISLDLLTGARV